MPRAVGAEREIEIVAVEGVEGRGVEADLLDDLAPRGEQAPVDALQAGADRRVDAVDVHRVPAVAHGHRHPAAQVRMPGRGPVRADHPRGAGDAHDVDLRERAFERAGEVARGDRDIVVAEHHDVAARTRETAGIALGEGARVVNADDLVRGSGEPLGIVGAGAREPGGVDTAHDDGKHGDPRHRVISARRRARTCACRPGPRPSFRPGS